MLGGRVKQSLSSAEGIEMPENGANQRDVTTASGAMGIFQHPFKPYVRGYHLDLLLALNISTAKALEIALDL